MKKALLTLGLVPIMLALVLFVSPEKASAQSCEESSLGTICTHLEGGDIVVTLLGQEIARISAPVKEVEVQVPVPGPTKIINAPGPTKTVKIPGPTKTIRYVIPGPTTTATATVTIRPTGHEAQDDVTVKPSATSSPQDQATVKVTPKPKVLVKEHEKKVRVTVPQAIGLSVGLLLLGLVLGLLALYAAYAIGYKNSEQAEAKAWHKLYKEILGKKRKH